jgi:CRP/FNR family cyclic AMP-dependent transcriptional regulator
MTPYVCNAGVLTTMPFFSALTDAEIAAVIPHVQHRRYPARAHILRAGERTDGLYVVLSGRVIVVHDDGDGHRFIPFVLGPGQFCGELGLLEGAPCSVSLQSQEPCELLFLLRARVLEYLKVNVGAALSLLRGVATRLDQAHLKMERLALSTVYDRVAHVLLETALPSAAHGEFLVSVGAEQIAAMVGASREMVSRVVADMIEKQVVRRHRRKLIVLDRSALGRERTSRRRRNPAPAADTSSRPAELTTSLQA